MITRATLSTIEQGLPKYRSMLAGNTAFSPAGEFESITTTIVGSGGSASVTFSSIPSTYAHLQLRYIARHTAASGAANVIGSFNGDTTFTNYYWHVISSDGANAQAAAVQTAGARLSLGLAPGATNLANVFGIQVVDILDYKNTNKNKTVRVRSIEENNTSGEARIGSGAWFNTNAITSITLAPATGNFAEYSHFALYGIRNT